MLKDLEIGPTTTIAYLNGNYAHLRELLSTLRKLANKYPTRTIQFHGRMIDTQCRIYWINWNH